MTPARRGHYGVDAPGAVVGLCAGTLGFAGWGIGLLFVVPWLAWIAFALAAVMLGATANYLHSTRRGKFLVWEGLLASLAPRGDEEILDAGCGRGAVLTAAARHVPGGRVTGVDLWRSVDQSGNAESATRANARAEGVADRVLLVTADLRELPWDAPSFDLALSALAIHNIKGAADRRRAVLELARVLRPGGRVVIADIAHVRNYASTLRAAGLAGIAITDPGWRYWFSPWVRTKIVTAHRGA